MDYKEEYQKALERAKMILCNLPEGSSSTRNIETIFPELKENEDERMRKELIEYLTHRTEVTGFIDEDKDCKKWIAWLEKQKEAQPGDEDRYMEGYMNGINDALKRAEPTEWSEEDLYY